MQAPPNERKVAIERFTSCPEVSVLLLSVELGSHGLDLSCASHVFILDPVLDYSKQGQTERIMDGWMSGTCPCVLCCV